MIEIEVELELNRIKEGSYPDTQSELLSYWNKQLAKPQAVMLRNLSQSQVAMLSLLRKNYSQICKGFWTQLETEVQLKYAADPGRTISPSVSMHKDLYSINLHDFDVNMQWQLHFTIHDVEFLFGGEITVHMSRWNFKYMRISR